MKILEELIKESKLETVDRESIKLFAELLIKRCSGIAMEQHISTGFDSYDDLDLYDQGCDDTASVISSRILDLLK